MWIPARTFLLVEAKPFVPSRAVIKFLISRNLCMYTRNNLQVSREYNTCTTVTCNIRNIHWAQPWQVLRVTALNDSPVIFVICAAVNILDCLCE